MLTQPPRALHVMAKPIGPICNLDCAYCYYLEKEALYDGNRRWRMADDLLETYIQQYIEAQDVPEITFAWQGGEPTLLGVPFFRRIVALQRRYANDRTILNTIQTNGTLLDDEWGAFLAEHRFLVGISIDGPRELHEAYRVDKQGRPTFDAVKRGLETLKRHGVEFNTLTVVNRKNSTRPLDVYRFLTGIGSRHLQFIPLVERPAPPSGLVRLSHAPPPKPGMMTLAPVTEWSVEAEQYGEFLVAVYDEWVRKDVGRVFVQQFEAALGNWYGTGPGLCVFAPTCGEAMAIEHNGDVYACDHYVYPEYRRGNVRETSLAAMAASSEQRQFGREKASSLPAYCQRCEVRFACHGECPKHRFMPTPDGEPGLNYLCPAYRRFFRHVDPTMRAMVALLRAQRSPAGVMAQLRAAEAGPPRKVGRNDPCPCGSGRKHKVCCGRG
jgi:uncharacterized protein